MSDVLDQICATKRDHIAARKQAVPEAELRAAAARMSSPRGFAQALRDKVASGAIGLIAEIKKASPSKGVIREDFDASGLAAAYHGGGATCLSVLTDTPYFQGDDRDLGEARAAVPMPILRKDVILDPYQVTESRALGADCILLIMAALADDDARRLEDAASALGMNVLIEVHDAAELERALVLGSPLIGINNRNLKTLAVDLATTEALAPQVPEDRILICESGIADSEDIARMRAAGAHCFLVGESLMREADVARATHALMQPVSVG